ncbi:TetR/AcrR family transcriptional regulator [Haloarchaeobius amylolyticus]|uniref:TetR/AcrR family transcriptional regulator n=1 Tax=Haloarchaeobius amylolyticus TaxID=1198296 RepID=UPI00226DB87F|nr:TetR/AcrR family transcriptional regulator [Haloarchaeobius amylolyticus]
MPTGEAGSDEETDLSETQVDIMEAVLRALAKHGYAGLTTKKVAAEASVSEAGLYYHYDSKDDLVVAFLEWSVERDSKRLSAAADADPVTRLFALCDALLGDPEDEVDRGINVAIMELLAHAPFNDRFHDLLRSYEERVHETLASVIREGVEAGVFREDLDPEATAAYLLVTTDGSAGAVMALGMGDLGEQVRERLFAYLRENVLAEGVDAPASYQPA